MNDIQTVKDAFTKKDKKVGRILSEKRVLAFRDEEHAIDNKSHLKFIEAKVDFTTDSFIKGIQDAIQKQVDFYKKPVSAVSPSKIVAPPEKEKPVLVDTMEDLLAEDTKVPELNMTVDAVKNKELKAAITEILKVLGAKKDQSKTPGVVEIFTLYGQKKLELTAPTEMFEKVLAYVK